MTVSTLEARAPERQQPRAPRAEQSSGAPVAAPGRSTRPRPAHRDGRRTAPRARPTRPLDTPVITRAGTAAAQSCRTSAPQPVVRPAQWRLTERAIALVLVTGLVIVTAALAVVGLTAVRVTGDRYQGPSVSLVASAPPSLP
ncbi:hypothetical protein [uncultured Friedmanniella sp.]|uniref:hypothetical protein n=1 Tax=uncultured Friedmanniella sp. TaxID=335381 RepID=UPI0035CA8E98